MSSIFSGLSRDERLLPITDHHTLSTTGDYRAVFLDATRQPALYDHVDHYWRQQHTVQRTQQQYMHTVLRSTKLPVKRIAFPDTRPPAPATATHQGTTKIADEAPHASIPALVAAQRTVSITSPYERLVWPSLLQSPLVEPWVTETAHTAKEAHSASHSASAGTRASRMFYNTSSSFASSSSAALSQGTLCELCELSAQHSMPAQETILLYTLALTYLDVVVPSGVPIHALPWRDAIADLHAQPEEAELEAARYSRVLWFQSLLLPHESVSPTTTTTATTTQDESERGTEKGPSATSSLPASANAEQEAQTQTTSAGTTAASPLPSSSPFVDSAYALDPPRTFQALQTRVAQVVLFFQNVAAHPEARTPPAGMRLSQAALTPTTATGAAASVPPPPPPQRHVAFTLMKLAARDWLARRGATVSPSKLLGCSATAHTARDLTPFDDDDVAVASGRMRSHVHATEHAKPTGADADSAAPHEVTRAERPKLDSTTTNTTQNGISASVHTSAPPNHRREADDDVCFQPCEPRTTTRDDSAFSLPPLPCDPLAVFSVPVSHTVLLACMQDTLAVLTLRERILVETGAQCAALVALHRAHVIARTKQSETSTTAMPTTTASSALLGNSREPSRASSLPLLRSYSALSATTQNEPVDGLVFPLLTRDPLSSSYAIYGPQALGPSHTVAGSREVGATAAVSGWRWNDAVGWKGFAGWLLRCYDDAPDTNTAAVRTSSSSSSSCVTISPPSPLPFHELGLEMTLADLPVTMEELADLCCRLGARLPRLPHARRLPLLQLSKPLQQWVAQVFQRHLLDIYLHCKRQRVQAFHVRAGPRGVALTLLQGDGKEEKVGSPGELAAEAHAAAAAAAHAGPGGAGGGGFSPAALQLVAESGYEDAALWLKYLVDHRAERQNSTRQILWYTRVPAADDGGDGRRSGQAVFAPTPPQGPSSSASASSASPAKMNDSVTSDTRGVLHQLQVVSLRRAEESVLLRIFCCHPGAVYLAGCGVEQVLLDAKDGNLLIQRRCCGEVLPWELRDCYELKLAGHPLRMPLHSVAAGPDRPLPLPQGVPDAALRVGLAQMRGMLQYYHRSVVASLRQRDRDAAKPHGTSNNPTTTGDDEALLATANAAATGAAPSLAMQSQAQWPETRRTVLYPTDRAIALFVLRHHPQYYTHVRGCGVVEVYVACTRDAAPATTTTAAAAASEQATATTSATAPAAAAAAATTGAGKANAVTAAGPVLSTPTAATNWQTGQATFLIERACGTLVPVALESCYTTRAPHALLPPLQLVEMERGGSSSLRTTQRSDAASQHVPAWHDSRSVTPSRPSTDLKRPRPW